MRALHEIIHENVRDGELYEKLDRNWVRGFACGHCCKIPEGQSGVCKDRCSLILCDYLRPAKLTRKGKARPWPPAKEPKWGASAVLPTATGFRRSKMSTA